MNRRFLVISVAVLSLVLLVTGTLQSKSLKIRYLEGRLVSRVGSSLTELSIDDGISGDATLVLSDDGYAELQYGEAVITLIKDGSYSVEELISGNETRTGFQNLLSGISTIFKIRPDNSIVAATRAAKPEDCDDQIFEGDFHLNNGMDRMLSGNYDCASLHFIVGMNDSYSPAEEQRECAFRLGTCYLADGEPRKAREHLLTLDPPPEISDTFYGEYVVTIAALYIESREYQKADVLLSSYLAGNPEGEAADAAAYLKQLVG